jgi:hypothetical protein
MTAHELSATQRIAMEWLRLASPGALHSANAATRVMVLAPVKLPAALLPASAKARQRC